MTAPHIIAAAMLAVALWLYWTAPAPAPMAACLDAGGSWQHCANWSETQHQQEPRK